jgi:hypothetical protein
VDGSFKCSNFQCSSNFCTTVTHKNLTCLKELARGKYQATVMLTFRYFAIAFVIKCKSVTFLNWQKLECIYTVHYSLMVHVGFSVQKASKFTSQYHKSVTSVINTAIFKFTALPATSNWVQYFVGRVWYYCVQTPSEEQCSFKCFYSMMPIIQIHFFFYIKWGKVKTEWSGK